MRYGFVIDNRKCIGCHACTVACKTENHVPLTVNRTWVKYVENGIFPNTRRVFQVTRCNHCEKPPCVTICPVTAMYQRKDGIVDFSSDLCIGCKACMQACPYDSIYIDPDEGTAAKCHFCAHRTEVGLEPSCVVVCPEHAIIAGDLDQCDGEIAQLLARETVRVRKPEQGTRPKLYYIDADESAIVPTAARHESIYMWAERNQGLHGGGALYPPDSPLLQKNALAAYDVSHARPWAWQVPAYCWTKGIGSGVLAIPAIAMLLGRLGADRWRDVALSTIALLFTALTTVLLVWDLEHKARFLRVVFRPQSKSWLARGAFILIAYSGLSGAFWLASVLGFGGVSSALLWPTVLVGFFAAIYTAFLFGQCEGSRPVADSAAAGAFAGADFDVRSRGASAAAWPRRRFGADCRGRKGCSWGHVDAASADCRGGIHNAARYGQRRIRRAVDHARTFQELVLGRGGRARRDSSVEFALGAV